MSNIFVANKGCKDTLTFHILHGKKEHALDVPGYQARTRQGATFMAGHA
jgi:hypothetical protein